MSGFVWIDERRAAAILLAIEDLRGGAANEVAKAELKSILTDLERLDARDNERF